MYTKVLYIQSPIVPWPDCVKLLIGSDVNNYSSDVSNNNNNSPMAGSSHSVERTYVNKLGPNTSWPEVEITITPTCHIY